MQGGSAIPKRCDLPHGDFLKFSLPPLPLSALSCLAPPEATFLCTGTNFRRYITSYEYPMDTFGYAKLYIYKEKVTFSCATKLSRGESIFFEEAYDFSFSLPIAIVSSRLGQRPPLLSNYSHLVIIAKSAETQKRDTNVAGRI